MCACLVVFFLLTLLRSEFVKTHAWPCLEIVPNISLAGLDAKGAVWFTDLCWSVISDITAWSRKVQYPRLVHKMSLND